MRTLDQAAALLASSSSVPTDAGLPDAAADNNPANNGALELRPFYCRNCHRHWAEAFCDECGARLTLNVNQERRTNV